VVEEFKPQDIRIVSVVLRMPAQLEIQSEQEIGAMNRIPAVH
jgi:hypothetical protein